MIFAPIQALAHEMVQVAHQIRSHIIDAFTHHQASDRLQTLLNLFAAIQNSKSDQTAIAIEFADIVAQTLVYGLFAAKMLHLESGVIQQQAKIFAPKNEPFLQQLIETIAHSALNDDLNDDLCAEPITHLIQLLDRIDIKAILDSKYNQYHDPIVHFYELFLAQYNSKLRESRGVYYTPKPIVLYMVRSIDYLLKTRFNLPDGLADKIMILDPACGTGIFLRAIVEHIQHYWMQQGDIKLALPYLLGFEVLLAPYTIAHLTLSLQLTGQNLTEAQWQTWSNDCSEDDRLGIYLINTLEEAETTLQMYFDHFKALNQTPLLVILGNPPYAVNSPNKGVWIENLVRSFYYPNDHLKEQNPKLLLDDYVKFIRWAQWQIEQVDRGIVTLITNHGYLDNPTFRKMRQSLMQTFDEIYVLNLHGNSHKKERCPDGSKDENVFDIQQGVAIGIFIKSSTQSTLATVHHADLWGLRENHKYPWLSNHDMANTIWEKLSPQAPFYLFTPQDSALQAEYDRGWKITDIMPVHSTGIKTHRDHFVIAFDRSTLQRRIEDFRNLSLSDREILEIYRLSDTRDWKLEQKRRSLAQNSDWQAYFTQCLYRPFDIRSYYHHEDVVELPRNEVMRHLLRRENIGLFWTRPLSPNYEFSVFCGRLIPHQCVIGNKTMGAGASYIGTLYLDSELHPEKGDRIPNLHPEFTIGLQKSLGLQFTSKQTNDVQTTFTPEDIFHYIYAIFHSPTYRARYAECLKIDFPRVPLISNVQLFRSLCPFGKALMKLHLMEETGVEIIYYPIPGTNTVEKVQFVNDRVWINKTQYFLGVSFKVWNFQIGGYQVCRKWLNDRQGRHLTLNEVTHYQQTVSAIADIIELMQTIDSVIEKYGSYPIQ